MRWGAEKPRRAAALHRALLATLIGLGSLAISATGTGLAQGWTETRFHTGCDPGPYHEPQGRDPAIPPPVLPADAPESVTLSFNVDQVRPPLLGTGFNFEHALWSCRQFRPVFRREILETFRPAIARVDTGLLPVAPPNLGASELNRSVYQSVLASEPYASSWAFFRRLNREDVRVILGVWGGPPQFTSDATRFGTVLPEYYDDYVEYLVSLVDFIVRQQSIKVWAITIANEPDGGDGNRLPPEGLAYVAHQLAPQLAAYDVKLYGPDTGSAANALQYLPYLLEDPVVSEALAFVGFHEYNANPQVEEVVDYVHSLRPDLPVIVTEYTSFNFGDLDDGQEANNHLGFTLDVANTLLSHYRHGADAALYWDAVDYLQPGHEAITKWGLLRGPGYDFAPRRWYYGFEQLLPYLQPGAHVLPLRQDGGDDLGTLAVRTDDDGLAVFAVNLGVAGIELTVRVAGAQQAGIGSLVVTRTDHDSNAAYQGRVHLTDESAQLYLPGRSITTLHMTGPRITDDG